MPGNQVDNYAGDDDQQRKKTFQTIQALKGVRYEYSENRQKQDSQTRAEEGPIDRCNQN